LQHVESAASALGNVSSILVFSKPQLVSWSGMFNWSILKSKTVPR
jgi:hypothetical protein